MTELKSKNASLNINEISAHSRLKLAKVLWGFEPRAEQAELFVTYPERLRHIELPRGSGVTTLLAYDVATYALTNPLNLQVVFAGSFGRSNFLLEQIKQLLYKIKDHPVANRLFPFSKYLWMKSSSIHFGESRPPSVTWESPNRALRAQKIGRLILDCANDFRLIPGELSSLVAAYHGLRLDHITIAETFTPDMKTVEEVQILTERDWKPFVETPCWNQACPNSEIVTAEDWMPFIEVLPKKVVTLLPKRLRREAGYICPDTEIKIDGHALRIPHTDYVLPSRWRDVNRFDVIRKESEFVANFRSHRIRGIYR